MSTFACKFCLERQGTIIRINGSLPTRVRYTSSFKVLKIRHGHLVLYTLFLTLLRIGEQVLLLDEPTSALDPISTRHIEDTVLQLKRTRGLTVIMVSHSLDQVRRLCDLVCVVIAGKLVEVLSPEELHEAVDPLAKEFLDAAQQH
jgi:ABC-type sugar transport system ATPase subunit